MALFYSFKAIDGLGAADGTPRAFSSAGGLDAAEGELKDAGALGVVLVDTAGEREHEAHEVVDLDVGLDVSCGLGADEQRTGGVVELVATGSEGR